MVIIVEKKNDCVTGELWDVFCEYFDEKRSCYKGVLLYSLMGVGVTGSPLSTNWSGRVLQAISSVMILAITICQCEKKWLAMGWEEEIKRI